jgi:hypothetical protein|tara:strand:+ start:105 stop:344 length:240 start_codon:yes stop_codon:yes gene_type:complete
MTKFYLETIADHAIAAGIWTTCFIVVFGLIFYYLHKWYIYQNFRQVIILLMALDHKLNQIQEENNWVGPHDPGDEHVPN